MEENAVLLRAYARAQERCSRLLAEQAAQIVRLRAALIVRDSALAMVREALAVPATGVSLPKRLQNLLLPARRRATRSSMPEADLREKAVLCVGRAEEASAMARQLVEIAGGRYLHHDGQDDVDVDAAALEASLRAADLVICQTGCMSHGAYWRVQDHCRRTGKPCVLVGQEQPIRIVRRGEVIASEAGS
ncbi:DUF2325 domain-containing protein [Variovorax sp. LT1R16]|uniref:DUF2325 domain-containing protein n=1 Tax=Variovorax sp. LT1R16 TaxID=3443728 RepID=UPI003F4662FC